MYFFNYVFKLVIGNQQVLGLRNYWDNLLKLNNDEFIPIILINYEKLHYINWKFQWCLLFAPDIVITAHELWKFLEDLHKLDLQIFNVFVLLQCQSLIDSIFYALDDKLFRFHNFAVYFSRNVIMDTRVNNVCLVDKGLLQRKGTIILLTV